MDDVLQRNPDNDSSGDPCFATPENSQTIRCFTLAAIETHTQKFPEKIAASFEGESISYRELEQQSQILANALISSFGPKPVCACSIRPSLFNPVILLAILKSGGTYVPIDPDFPETRIIYILETTGANICFVSDSDLANFPKQTSRHSFSVLASSAIDRFCENALKGQLDNSDEKSTQPLFEKNSTHSDIAYIFFTSGTTGNPKAVQGSYSNLNYYVQSAIQEFHLDTQTHMAVIAKFSFSISLFDLLCPLVAGGTIEILPRDLIVNDEAMLTVFTKVNTFHIGPTLLRKILKLLDATDPAKIPSFAHIRHASSGGDIVPADIMLKLGRIFPNAEIFTIYGCTEIACMGCRYELNRENPADISLVGKAFPNTQAILLDENFTPVDQGEKGEIFFSGPGVTSGYINNEQENTSKFIDLNGQRFYRTGDIGAKDKNGNIAVLGRKDFQVKINGIRVELAEIETQIKSLTKIHDAAVMNFLVNDETKIYGFLVGDIIQSDIKEIRLALKEKLPSFMVPNGFVILDKLPLNNNMKVDRKALTLPSRNELVRETQFQAAITDTQISLVKIWQTILKEAQVGIDDDFFALGGDSLAAAQMLSSIHSELLVALPIQTFLQRPVLRDIAELIDSKDKQLSCENTVELKSGDSTPLFCFYGVLLYRDLANALPEQQRTIGVFLHEELELLAKNNLADMLTELFSVRVIAEKYINEIKKSQPQGPYLFAGESFGGIVALEAASILSDQGETVSLVAMLDSWLPHSAQGTTFRRNLEKAVYLASTPQKLYQKVKSHILNNKKNIATNTTASPQFDIAEKARLILTQNYIPPTYSGEVVFYQARESDPRSTFESSRGWSKYLKNLTVKTIPGDHLGILKHPNVDELARDLAGRLKK